jgi:hypothetical protein
LSYDPAARTYDLTHDWTSNRSLGATVVEAVATARDADPTTLEPLADAIDPDALDEVFRPASGRRHRNDGNVTFVFAGTHVTVWGDGTVEVRPLAD